MPPNFYCEKCDFKCFKQSIYNTHLDTAKHKKHGYILPYPEEKDTIVSIQPWKISEGGGHKCPYCFKSYKYHSFQKKVKFFLYHLFYLSLIV